MVGGIVVLRADLGSIPAEWRQSREALPNWPFNDAYAGTMTLYRPVGAAELALIAASGYRAFPPRLPEQPIFYPVLSEAYAAQIARDWNTKNGATGYVTRFEVRASYLERYTVQIAGARMHAEYWIPAEDLEIFNDSIVGTIDVIGSFAESPESAKE